MKQEGALEAHILIREKGVRSLLDGRCPVLNSSSSGGLKTTRQGATDARKEGLASREFMIGIRQLRHL